MTPRWDRTTGLSARRPPIDREGIRGPLETLEGRTLFAAAPAAGVPETFLIGGEVVVAQAAAEPEVNVVSATSGGLAAVGRTVIGVPTGVGRVTFAVVAPFGGTADAGQIRLVRLPDGSRPAFPPMRPGSDDPAGNTDDGTARSDGTAATRHPLSPRAVPQVAQTVAAGADETGDPEPAAEARSVADVPTAAPAAVARADRPATSDAVPAAARVGETAAAAAAVAPVPAVAGDATAGAVGVTAAGVPAAGPRLEPLTDRASAVAPAAAAMAAAFAGPAVTLRDAIGRLAADALPSDLTTLFSTGVSLSLLQSSVPTLAGQLMGLAASAADGLEGVGVSDGASHAAAGLGAVLAAAGYWQTTGYDREREQERERRRSAASPVDGRGQGSADGWSLLPMEGR